MQRNATGKCHREREKLNYMHREIKLNKTEIHSLYMHIECTLGTCMAVMLFSCLHACVHVCVPGYCLREQEASRIMLVGVMLICLIKSSPKRWCFLHSGTVRSSFSLRVS